MPGLVAVELRRHLRDHHNEALLFRRIRGTPVVRRDQFDKSAWKPALRHLCASTLLADGAPLTAVAGHLGDTAETVSRTYVHWLRDDRDAPAAVLDPVLAPGTEDSLRTAGE